MQSGSCGFIGYTEKARRYWKAQAHATTVAATKDTPTTPEVAHRFGECPGCNNGINDESEFVLITTGDNGEDNGGNGGNGDQPVHAAESVSIRCISCYEVMCMANRTQPTHNT